MIESMSCCHAITRVQNKLIGDPLELKMLEATGYIFEDSDNSDKYDELVLATVRAPGSDNVFGKDRQQSYIQQSIAQGNIPQTIGIIRRFEFSSKLQRMSVIVKNLQDNKFRIHVKGSPEKLRELCRADTIPKTFHKILDVYAKNGYR